MRPLAHHVKSRRRRAAGSEPEREEEGNSRVGFHRRRSKIRNRRKDHLQDHRGIFRPFAEVRVCDNVFAAFRGLEVRLHTHLENEAGGICTIKNPLLVAERGIVG